MAELNPMFDSTFGSDPAPGNIDRPGFLALGFDPAPGSIERINTLADCLSDIARDLGEAYTDLKNLGKSEGIWTGTAAQAFANTVEELPEYLDKANSSFNDASSALSGWAQDLGEMQRKAASLEAEAAKAMANLIRAEANPDLGLVDQIFELGPELENAQRRLYAAQAELERARANLEDVRRRAEQLREQHDHEAIRVAAALDRAREIAPDLPWIDVSGILESIGNFFSDIGDAIGDFLSDVSDVLAKIGDCLSFLSDVAGALALATAFIPGVNAVTAAAAAGLSAAAAGTRLLAKAGGANVSWADIGMDALGAFPGGKLGKFAKLGNTGTAGAKTVKWANRGTIRRTISGLQTAVEDAVEDAAYTAVKNTLRKVGLKKIQPADYSNINDLARNLSKGKVSEIIHDTARQSHLDNVASLNKHLNRIGIKANVNPDTTAGSLVGATYGTLKDMAMDEVKDFAKEKIEEHVVDPLKEKFQEHIVDPLKKELREQVGDPIRDSLREALDSPDNKVERS